MEHTNPESIDLILAKRVFAMPEFKPMVQGLVAEEVRRQLDAMHLTKNYYTPKELAKHLKIEKQTIYSHVKKGLLKPERSGRNMRFTFEAVQNYLK